MLPTLNEKTGLDAALVNGLPASATTASGRQTATVSFVGEDAGFENTLGYVTVAADGTLGMGSVVFQNVDGPDRRTAGPLSAGDSVEIGTFDDGTQLDLFLIQNGNDLGIDFSDGIFSFERADGSPANINDTSPPRLIFTVSDGSTVEIQAPVFHSAAAGLNPVAAEHVVSATDDDGSTLISFEDVVATAGNFDGDFNDASFDLSFADADGSTPPPEPTPPEPTPPEPTPPEPTPPEPTPPAEDQTATSDPVTLPDGQEVAVSITTESTTDDDTAQLTGALSLTGFLASSFNVAYVIDRSFSTNSFARDANGSILDIDGDGVGDRVLDVEQAAFAELNSQLIGSGLGNSDLAVIQFNSSASTIATVTVGQDSNGDGVADAVDAINSLQSGGGTNYEPALQLAIDFFESQGDGDSATNVVYFLSDGQPNQQNFADEVAELQNAAGVDAIVNAIGAGAAARQETLDQVDNTGGAQVITDLSQLAAGLSASSLDIGDILSVDISVNGVVQTTLDSSAFTDSPTGPQFGPVTLTGLDPTAVNTVDLEATVTTDNGGEFDLVLSTEIVGIAGSADMALAPEDMPTMA